MSEQNKAVVRNCWAVASTGNVSAVGEFYDEDVVYHGSGGEAIRGRESVTAFLQGYFSAFPDMKMTIEDIFGEGDRVFSRVRAEGTHKGELMGMPATGRAVTISWIMNVARVANGKIVEEWEVLDLLDVMRQLGAVAEASPATAPA